MLKPPPSSPQNLRSCTMISVGPRHYSHDATHPLPPPVLYSSRPPIPHPLSPMAKGKLQNTLSPVTVDVAYPPLIHNRESKRFSFTVPEAANNQGRPRFPSPVCGVQGLDLQKVNQAT